MIKPVVRSVRDAEVSGKRVLVRVDFNVPIKDGKVAEDMRIRVAIPTLELIHEHGASQIVLITHIGRPDGKVVEELRVAPVAARLRELTSIPFTMEENLRFDPGDEANDPEFAKKLASLGDIFVNDAFSVSHRAHASTVGVAQLLPSYAGLNLEKEIEKLSGALTPPQGAVALMAVTKKDKIPLIDKLAGLYAKVLVGGPVPPDYVPSAPNILIPADGIPELTGLLDIGPNTREAWVAYVAQAPFVLWNGPLGWYEKGYTQSTDAIANQIIASGTEAVIGGGDTVAALEKFQFNREKVFISTGGGAMLEFLIAGTLPGIEVLK
ncbi:MAG TPA: phosphoglycerate kinase [Candidatus Paceibacterota bacterium]|nr:phosphoglycerate kinase [Candidatus Paceibacterota bacterium]